MVFYFSYNILGKSPINFGFNALLLFIIENMAITHTRIIVTGLALRTNEEL